MYIYNYYVLIMSVC